MGNREVFKVRAADWTWKFSGGSRLFESARTSWIDWTPSGFHCFSSFSMDGRTELGIGPVRFSDLRISSGENERRSIKSLFEKPLWSRRPLFYVQLGVPEWGLSLLGAARCLTGLFLSPHKESAMLLLRGSTSTFHEKHTGVVALTFAMAFL